MKKYVLLFIALFFSSCGSLSVDSGDSGSDFSASEINSISSALTQAVSAVSSDFYSQNSSSVSQPALMKYYQQTFPLNGEYACPVDGHITYSGNITATASETSASVSGQITFQVSDPTNNLNDCEIIEDDLILDGTLYLSFYGNMTSTTMVLDGTIGINERGPTGGLVPITDDCSIYITYSNSSTYGHICGQSVSSN